MDLGSRRRTAAGSRRRLCTGAAREECAQPGKYHKNNAAESHIAPPLRNFRDDATKSIFPRLFSVWRTSAGNQRLRDGRIRLVIRLSFEGPATRFLAVFCHASVIASRRIWSQANPFNVAYIT